MNHPGFNLGVILVQASHPPLTPPRFAHRGTRRTGAKAQPAPRALAGPLAYF